MANPREPGRDETRCIEVVDLVTEYLDGELSEEERRRFQKHLEGCEGCRAALDQFQTVIRLTGRLSASDVAHIDARIRDRLIATSGVIRRR
jgi:anti-sigma factor (TIGR02949 family)